ncbi:hypothetical protein ASPCAL12466 [Aspergillus calidoustus]|uniref:Cytochrome b561 domain-containing protein n=1 Tax=Aspergillus calidoustus TaxID=454130 RepID=A0A0U5GCA4_ASPCI|nr:hypothetical protein ASPCAL12466 [Aspergillus calidoustus]
MQMNWALIIMAFGFMRSAIADIYSFRANSKIAYSIAVVSSSVGSEPTDLFFQIVAPTSYEWVALGQGTGMAGANIFVMYSSSLKNNITLSPRSGKGHVMPEYNPAARVDLLDGTGISNGYMTANVRCASCLGLSPSNWIWAAKEGSPISSSDKELVISEHDFNGRQSINLEQATITNLTTSNPFTESTDPNPTASPPASTSDSESPGTGVLVAHGSLMAIAFIILFPVSALSLHVIPYAKTVTRVHAPLQLFTLCVVAAGLAIGAHLAVTNDELATYHPIIGLVVVGALILFQPALGLFQHLRFRRTREKTSYAYIHRWLGRILILLGIVNGGLGFMLVGIGEPGSPTSAVVIYSVLAGVVVLIYIAVLAIRPAVAARKVSQSAGNNPQDWPTSEREGDLQLLNIH